MRLVDAALMRQVTADAMRIYEAIERMDDMSESEKALVAAAESLVSETTSVYLGPDAPLVDESTEAESETRAKAIGQYVAIQRSYAVLRSAFYRLVFARLAAKQYAEAQQASRAMAKACPDFRDVRVVASEIDELMEALVVMRRDAEAGHRKLLALSGRTMHRETARACDAANKENLDEAVHNHEWSKVEGLLRSVFRGMACSDRRDFLVRQRIATVPFLAAWLTEGHGWCIEAKYWHKWVVDEVPAMRNPGMHESFYIMALQAPREGVFVPMKMWSEGVLTKGDEELGLLIVDGPSG